MASIDRSVAPADVKVNLIWPCKESHVAKYSRQPSRVVTETPDIFAKYVRPYMVRKTQEGRLNWVYNILEGRQEQQDIIVRSSRNLGHDPEGFLLLPDMNWDRTTMANLRLIALVERRDLFSMRDLKKKDAPWLKTMQARLFEAAVKKYGGIESDMLKAYVHYQPTYYHLHIHIVSVALEPNATQAVGKAFSLPNLISQLETMGGGPEAGFADLDFTYGLGEKSELWTEVFLPLKEGKSPTIGAHDASNGVAH
jgi:m7GpppX diphosphatase